MAARRFARRGARASILESVSSDEPGNVIGRVLLLLAAAALLLPAQAAGPAEATEYRLGSGDKLRVTVFGQEDLSGEFLVNGAGEVSLPLVGNLRLGGLTVREAERRVVDALKPDYLVNPRVSIQVLNFRPFYIIGEVKEPGSYPYVGGMTVTEAVALAGGYTYRAKKKEVIIIRGNDPKRTEQPATDTTPVLPGDVIKVPERFF